MTSRLEHVHVNDERSDLVINITNPKLLLMDSPIGRNLIVHPALAFFLGVISAFFKLLLFSFSCATDSWIQGLCEQLLPSQLEELRVWTPSGRQNTATFSSN